MDSIQCIQELAGVPLAPKLMETMRIAIKPAPPILRLSTIVETSYSMTIAGEPG